MKKFKLLTLVFGVFVALMLSGCESNNAIALSTPTEVEVSADGSLIFKRVENDDLYVVNINGTDKVNIFVNSSNKYLQLFSKNNKNFVKYDLTNYFTVGETYSLKVKASGENRYDSEYSTTYSYTHKVKVETTNATISGTILTWQPVKNAASYVVKVVTPYDNIYNDTVATIGELDVNKYERTSNSFDFAPLLTKAGVYKFYVKAVGVDSAYLESEFSQCATYHYYVELLTPRSLAVNEVDDELHLTCMIDENASYIRINVNDKYVVLSLSDERVKLISGLINYIDINLNKIVQFAEQDIDFKNAIQFNVSVQLLKAQQDDEQARYKDHFIDSHTSATITYNNVYELSTVELTTHDNDKNIAWKPIDDENVSLIRVYVVVPEDGKVVIKKHNLTKGMNNLTLPNNYIATFVQTVGSGNYLDSAISTIQAHYTEVNTATCVVETQNNNIVWTEVENAKYVLLLDDKFVDVDTNSYSVFNIDGNVKTLKLCVFTDNFAPIIITKDIVQNVKRLAKPTNLELGTENPYLLYFNKSEHAEGYIVYLQEMKLNEDGEVDGVNGEKIAIQKLFVPEVASNGKLKIDLSKFVTQNGVYDIYVKAFAGKYSSYEDSELSAKTTLTYNRVLDTPKFTDEPIEKVVNGNTVQYFVNFYPVEGASSYEIVVNYGKAIVVSHSNLETSYKVPITMKNADEYTIMVRAVSANKALYDDSAYNITTYALREQLSEVTNIKYEIEDDAYILSFDAVTGAESYNVRVVRLNDANYTNYLVNLNLSNPLSTNIERCDITDYIKQQGKYYIYVTAIARDKNFYTDSNESSTFATIDKLESVKTPINLKQENVSATEYNVTWTGDSRCDYYLISIVDPLGHSISARSDKNTKYNINSAITVEGVYYVSVKSVVKSGNKEFYSSPYSDPLTITYTYNNVWDFERAKVFYNGANYSQLIETADQLAKVLWHYYVFGVDQTYYLNLSIKLNEEEKAYITTNKGTQRAYETATRHAILRLSVEASNKSNEGANFIYDFVGDADWKTLTGINDFTLTNALWQTSTKTNAELFGYVCEKLIELYPYMNVLQKLNLGASIEFVNQRMFEGEGKAYNQVFSLNYKNALDVTKIDAEKENIVTDYANPYKYLTQAERRNANTVFAIDECESMEVSSTEEMLMAVMYGKKPVFVCECSGICDGHCRVAENVYKNAKAVLIAIINSNMTEIEKVTAIFEWLEQSYNINLDANTVKVGTDWVQDVANLERYGKHKDFYLESIFANILVDKTTGNITLGNQIATSESFSKAFALMCGIEGIKTTIVNGTTTLDSVTLNHTWNKVYLSIDEADATWYNVDITYSDLLYNSTRVNNSYNVAGHTYFMVSDDYMVKNLNFNNKQVVLVEKEHSLITSYHADTTYNYYLNSTYEFDYDKMIEIQEYAHLVDLSNWTNIEDRDLTVEGDKKYYVVGTERYEKPDRSKYPNTEAGTNAYKKALENFNKAYFVNTSVKKYDENARYFSLFGTGRSARQNFILNALLAAAYEFYTNEGECATIEIKIDTNNNPTADITNMQNIFKSRTGINVASYVTKDYSYETGYEIVIFRLSKV